MKKRSEESATKERIRSTAAIGQMVKARRKELGIPQERIAAHLGVTYQQVQRYENGKNRLNVEDIQIIAAILNVPVNYFFGATTEKSPGLSPDERKILKLFRKIKNRAGRAAVITVARLAAQLKAPTGADAGKQ